MGPGGRGERGSDSGAASIASTEANVVVVDLGQIEPAAAARVIAGGNPGANLLAFGLDETEVFAAAGFSGDVPRAQRCRRALPRVLDVVAGRMHCTPHIAAAMFSHLVGLLREPDPHGPLPPLSARESEILALVREGRPNEEIVRQLRISAATVKNHMHNILQKLQVNRRGEAAARLRMSYAP